MSNRKDELKQLFDSAFAAEQIPFDAAGWAQMEAMLDKKSKRKAAWYWYSSAAAVLMLVAAIPFFSKQNETYVPRSAQPALSSDVSETKNSEEKNVPSIAQTTTHFEELKSVDQKQPINPARPSASIANNPQRNNFQHSGELMEINKDLEFLERLEAILPVTPYVYDSLYSDVYCATQNYQSKWQRYMIVGLTKSQAPGYGMFANAGQSFGIGLTYKLKNHIYLSGELALSRDMVGFQKSISSTHYGLSGTLIQQNILTSELIYADLPLLAQYRSNRLSIGAGPLFEYLMGLKNVETVEATTVYGSPKSSQQLQNGYFSWSDYKRFGLGWQFDASYQMFETMHLGARANFGANISATTEKIRRNRFELYLKFDL